VQSPTATNIANAASSPPWANKDIERNALVRKENRRKRGREKRRGNLLRCIFISMVMRGREVEEEEDMGAGGIIGVGMDMDMGTAIVIISKDRSMQRDE
jgi:hypothetical protein